MPLTYDQISAITQKKYIPKMADAIFDSNPLLQRAKKKFLMKVDGGEKILQPLNYAQVTSSGWFSGMQTLLTADNDIFTAAEFTWKQLYANITISRLDELKNSGDAQVLDLVKNKVKIAQKTMEDKLATGLYSNGSDSASIVGLRNIAASITSTIGGISQSSYSWWQPQLDSSTTTLTVGAMQSRDNACTVNNDSPSVIVTTRSLYNAYYAQDEGRLAA